MNTQQRPAAISGRKFIVVMILILIAAVALLVFLQQLALSDQTRPTDSAASRSLAEIPATWAEPIALPEFIPDCVAAVPKGAEVIPMAEASGGRALEIRFATAGPECNSAVPSDIILTQASALRSLPGQVTTISDSRQHFARIATMSGDGRTRVTLQWRCDGRMCRLSAEVKLQGLTEDALLKMAASVREVDL